MRQRLVFILACLVVQIIAIENVCNSFTNDMTTNLFPTPTTLNFGIGDNPSNPDETQYSVPLKWAWHGPYPSGDWNTNFLLDTDETRTSLLQEISPLFVNGHNLTSYSNDFVRTANFECGSNNQSFMWGPAYADFRDRIYYGNPPQRLVRAVDPNLEAYVHVSAPNTSSYIRYIGFITNKSNQRQKLRVQTSNYANYAFNDISPFNNGRYVTGYPWFDNDPGQDPSLRSEWSVQLAAINVRGPNAQDVRFSSYTDIDCYDHGLTYNGDIEAGETKAVMIVYSFAMNKTAMLQRAAWVDSEPAELFHDLTADQLSQIANWGACQSVLGPDVTVTVTPPSQCSSDMTSDFIVNATTTRNDLGAGFKHRVVLTQGTNEFEIVAAQSSTTLSVLNNIGQVKHQLWFKNCIVKETVFTACSNKPSAKRAIVADSVSMKKESEKRSSHALSLSVSSRAASATTMANVCSPFTKNMQTNEVGTVASLNFGINDSPDGQTMYTVPAKFDYLPYDIKWNTNLFFAARTTMNSILHSIGPLAVNSGYVMGGKNWTSYSSEYVRTADFECFDDGQTIMWGPSYPDVRLVDLEMRSQQQHLETYIHVSAPNATNYMRYIAFITNKSNKQEKLHIQTVNYATDAGLDISPLNDGRWITAFPFQEGDDGYTPGDAANYNKIVTSTHVRGPNARDTTIHSYNDVDCWDHGLTYNGAIEAGETKAFMIVYSFAPNKTRMLQSAAWVDTEPAELFHGLNADQLSQIVNWDACQKMLAPDVTVTVTPPSQCSSDMTSDFTVSATTTRSDFTSSFSHRVVGGVIPVEIVPVQSSNTLTVINDAGPVVHQLWYNGCMIKETPFNACETTQVPPSTPTASTTPAGKTPTGTVSSATPLTVCFTMIGAIAVLF